RGLGSGALGAGLLRAARVRPRPMAGKGPRARVRVNGVASVNAFDRLILSVKRRESPAARLAYQAYKKLIDFDIPDREITRILYGGVYVGHHIFVDAKEWAASKFLYAPMLRARCEYAGPGLNVTSPPYIRGHATIRIGQGCTFSTFAVH